MSSGLKVKDSAWCKNEREVDEPVMSFAEIMSEELVDQLMEEDARVLDPSIAQYGISSDELSKCADDFELARMLQEKFDLEYEMTVQSFKNKKTESKIQLGFKSYHSVCDSDEDCDEEISQDDEDLKEIRREIEKRNALHLGKVKDEFPSSGYVRNSLGNLITKHDKEISERRNSEKAMHLPIDFPTGNVIGEKLSNKVYNKLRSCSKADRKKNIRVKDKDEKATNEISLDKITRLVIYKFINAGLFDKVGNIIATGKESVVLHAMTHADGIKVLEEKHFALKVYKMTLSEFKNRLEYVLDDYRFKNPRRVLRIWAEREYTNLKRMIRAGVKCPEPIRLRRHIMIMTFIGSNGVAARKLKDIEWRDQKTIYQAFLQAVIKMFTDCNLVHGDLSEFNMLYYENHVYIIDVSQAMDTSHPRALFFLLRDINNVLEYFQKLNIEKLPSATEFFNDVTGLNMDPGESLLLFPFILMTPEQIYEKLNLYLLSILHDRYAPTLFQFYLLKQILMNFPNMHTYCSSRIVVDFKVEHFEKDNRSAQLRHDKTNPADMELRLYDAEVSETYEDPAELYN
ncbi:unnamed protein product [Thelazia callipaeda]|uniref:Serine/threonine-protein kinase RIO3 n=1 Tax=Thelazia callipaeda TaxID=103827 RepID=A0A0N5D1R4_THECL|nr:unnamed protein product [Thelazia callipaeda]